MLANLRLPKSDCGYRAPTTQRGLGAAYSGGNIANIVPRPDGLCDVWVWGTPTQDGTPVEYAGVYDCPGGVGVPQSSESGIIGSKVAPAPPLAPDGGLDTVIGGSVAAPVKVFGDTSAALPPVYAGGTPGFYDPVSVAIDPSEGMAEGGPPSAVGAGNQPAPEPSKFPWLTLALIAGAAVLGG